MSTDPKEKLLLDVEWEDSVYDLQDSEKTYGVSPYDTDLLCNSVLCAGDLGLRNPANDLSLSQVCVGCEAFALGDGELAVAADGSGVGVLYASDFPHSVNDYICLALDLRQGVHRGDGGGKSSHDISFVKN